jgi:flagellar biosynthesis/type III secretory pathway protein FliH
MRRHKMSKEEATTPWFNIKLEDLKTQEDLANALEDAHNDGFNLGFESGEEEGYNDGFHSDLKQDNDS